MILIRSVTDAAMFDKIKFTAKTALLRGLYWDLVIEGYHVWNTAKISDPKKVVKRKKKDMFRKLILYLEWVKRDIRKINNKIRNEN
jgi:hypothetical protein